MKPFAHTPYDGSRQPFTIGLGPLNADDWMEPDANLARDLDEKERLLKTRRDRVFREMPDTRAAQAETLGLLAAHLPVQFPEIYRLETQAMRIVPASRSVALHDGDAPLVIAARLVQEDLCLMRRVEAGWRLVAGVLCFPSGWSLAEKIGSDLAAIHAPVPDFAGAMESRVTRIFDNLRVEAPVVRFNWSLYGDGRLHRPPEAGDRFGVDAARAHIRIERQTLRRLPASRDILFTIRSCSDPIALFARDERGRELAARLRDQLLALTPAQASYKGLATSRAAIVGALSRIIECG